MIRAVVCIFVCSWGSDDNILRGSDTEEFEWGIHFVPDKRELFWKEGGGSGHQFCPTSIKQQRLRMIQLKRVDKTNRGILADFDAMSKS